MRDHLARYLRAVARTSDQHFRQAQSRPSTFFQDQIIVMAMLKSAKIDVFQVSGGSWQPPTLARSVCEPNRYRRTMITIVGEAPLCAPFMHCASREGYTHFSRRDQRSRASF